MASVEDLLLGKIVERCQMADRDQIRECLRAQEDADEPQPLGQLLVARGHITQDQLAEILDIQSQTYDGPHKDTRRTLRESLFGQLVALKRYARAGDVHECLRLQEKLREQGQHILLGELLVMKSRMTAVQVAEILREQNKMLFFCEDCLRRFNIVEYNPEHTYRCTECQSPLREPQPVQLLDVESEIATENS